MFSNFWQKHKTEILVIGGLILTAFFGIRTCFHETSEIIRKDRAAKKEIYYGNFSAYFQVSYNLCLSLLKEIYCPLNIEMFLKDQWLENLNDANEKHYVEGFFNDLMSYKQSCSILSYAEQKEQVESLYFRARNDPYITYHFDQAMAKISMPDFAKPDFRKPPSIKAEECDKYLQGLNLVNKHLKEN